MENMNQQFYISRIRDRHQREVCAVIRKSDGHPIFSGDTMRECRIFLNVISRHLYNETAKALPETLGDAA